MTPIRLDDNEFSRVLAAVSSDNAIKIVKKLYSTPVCSTAELRKLNDNYSSIVHNSINARVAPIGLRVSHSRGKYYFVHVGVVGCDDNRWITCKKPQTNNVTLWGCHIYD